MNIWTGTMLSLRDLQLGYLARTLDDAAAVATPWLVSRRLDSAMGLKVYRNNARIGFQKALQATFPVLVKLAGEDWFNSIAELYGARFPSRSGDLNDVGEQFADFLAEHLESDPDRYAHAYDYFPDIVRLEWIFQEVLNLADVAVPDRSELQARLAHFDDQSVLVVNPSARLLRSRFPVYEIWSWNRQQSDTAPPALDQGGSWVLVVKSAAQTRVRRLDPKAAILLRTLEAARPFADLIESPNIDFTRALAHLIQVHAIVGVTNPTGDSHDN